MTKDRTNRRMVLVGALALAVGTTLVAGAALAGHGGSGPDGFHGRMLSRMAERLELSEAQKVSVQEIFETHQTQAEPMREQMRVAREAVAASIEADVLDEEAVRVAAQQAADIGVELAVLRARVASEFRAVLTPDQRELLGQMRERRRQFRQEGLEHGFRGGHGRRGPGAFFGPGGE